MGLNAALVAAPCCAMQLQLRSASASSSAAAASACSTRVTGAARPACALMALRSALLLVYSSGTAAESVTCKQVDGMGHEPGETC